MATLPNEPDVIVNAILGDVYIELEMLRGEATIHLQTNDLKQFDITVNKLLFVSQALGINTEKYTVPK